MNEDVPFPIDRAADARDTAPPGAGASREALERALAELTLPLMWTMRQEAVRAFEPLDVRPIRVLLLKLVAGGFAHPKELAEILETVPPAVSNMLADLEGRGWLHREPDPEDGRRVRLTVTDAGEDLLHAVQRRWHAVSSARLAALTDDQLRLLIDVYSTLLAGETRS